MNKFDERHFDMFRIRKLQITWLKYFWYLITNRVIHPRKLAVKIQKKIILSFIF